MTSKIKYFKTIPFPSLTFLMYFRELPKTALISEIGTSDKKIFKSVKLFSRRNSRSRTMLHRYKIGEVAFRPAGGRAHNATAA